MPFQKHILLIIAIIFSTIISFAEQHSDAISASVADSVAASSQIDYLAPNQQQITDSVINYGKLFLNKPYRYGTSGADTFDCSGYTSFVYRNFGYTLGRSSADQAEQFDTVKRTQLKVGDLVFFSGRRRSTSHVGHVGIVITPKEDGKFEFIHASVDRGVTISSSEEDYYKRRFIKAGRVIGGTQLLAVLPSVSDNTTLPAEDNGPVTFQAKKIKKVIPAKFHKVKSGETLSGIAEKYDISVAELKRKNGIRGSKINLKQMLKIKDQQTYTVFEPVQAAATKSTNVTDASVAQNKGSLKVAENIATHKVTKGETLFQISKQYNISIDELKRINNLPSGTIIPGLVLKLNEPSAASLNVAKTETTTKTTTHKVISGESLFSIAKMYDISVEELRKINDLGGSSIQTGQILKVTKLVETVLKPAVAVKQELKPEPKPIAKVEPVVKQEAKPKVEVRHEVASTPRQETTSKRESSKSETGIKVISHKVHVGESLVTIARDFKVSLDELKRINNLEDVKLVIGQEVLICLNSEPVIVAASKDQAPILISKPAVSQPVPAEKSVKQVVSTPVQPKEQLEKPVVVAKPTVVSKPLTYKVKKGDNLNSIAEQLNVSVKELKDQNNLSGNKINIGQLLTVSKSTEGEEASKEVAKPEATVKSTVYKVKKGDDLYSIAKKFDMTVNEIKELNDLQDNKIHFGQELIVSQTAEKKSGSKTTSTKSKPKIVHHKVKPGESLYSIADKYDCTVKDLKEWNRKSGSKLQIGDELVIHKSRK